MQVTAMSIIPKPGATRPAQPNPGLAQLTPVLRAHLATEGIASLAAWRAVGRRRYKIFGVTRTMRAQIDALAKATP
jgi:hypothetical protein